MPNDAQDMWDAAEKEAKRIFALSQLLEQFQPLARDIAKDPLAAAVKMQQLFSENQELKKELSETRKALDDNRVGG